MRAVYTLTADRKHFFRNLAIPYRLEFRYNVVVADQPVKSGQKRGRSPSYPAIGLEEALRLARVLYEHENRNAVPLEAVIADWGLKPTSGRGWVVLAALLKFGLLQDEGKGSTRKAKLTDLALSIILDEREDGSQRQQLIRTAALKPTIHIDLWKKYAPILPSDASLRFYLEKERGFNPAAVPDLIRQFRQTVAFANLTEADKLAEHEGEINDAPADPFMVPAVITPATVTLPSSQARPATTRVLNLPLSGGTWAALQIPYPMSQEDWDQMLAVLEAMKRGIVRKSDSSEPEGS